MVTTRLTPYCVRNKPRDNHENPHDDRDYRPVGVDDLLPGRRSPVVLAHREERDEFHRKKGGEVHQGVQDPQKDEAFALEKQEHDEAPHKGHGERHDQDCKE